MFQISKMRQICIQAQCHSFHSSVLYLEQQDLGLDKGPQVNSKNQNIKELTSLSKHHQGMVRKGERAGVIINVLG